jgi:hypothetical protein
MGGEGRGGIGMKGREEGWEGKGTLALVIGITALAMFWLKNVWCHHW